jgi:hypothetical protein
MQTAILHQNSRLSRPRRGAPSYAVDMDKLKRLGTQLWHPSRRSIPDPTWLQVSVALIAAGALMIAAEAASTGKQTNYGVLYAGLGIGAVGVLGVVLCALAALLRWKDSRDTPFCLFHDSGDWECNESVTEMSQQLRVAVTNTSPTGVQRVRVFLRAHSSDDRSHFLLLEHDNNPPGFVSRRGEDLAAGQQVYFDVAFARRDIGKRYLSFADSAIMGLSERDLTPTRVIFDLTVSGWTDFYDVEPLTKPFRLTVHKDGQLSLDEVEPGAMSSD